MSDTPPCPALPEPALARLHQLLQRPGRRLLGLAGPPGSGKSSLAAAVRQALGEQAQVVPMDGFHLANSELQRLGRAQRKGAPDTFDSAGYVQLLQRLRAQREDEVVYAPEYRREVEEGIAGAIAVQPGTRLIITEGNYLLLPEGHWGHVRPLLDACWYLAVDDGLRNARLIERHQRFGRSAEAARAWAESTDEPNARLIAAQQGRADWVFRWA